MKQALCEVVAPIVQKYLSVSTESEEIMKSIMTKYRKLRDVRNVTVDSGDNVKSSKVGMLKKLKDQVGVTILEVLISMLILSIALLGLLGMGMTALEGNQWSNYSTKSTQLLQQKIEQLRNVGIPTSGTETIDDIDLSWTVGNAGSHLRSVDVTASWVNQRHQSVSNSLSTLIKTDSL